jgi:hypothetical protein
MKRMKKKDENLDHVEEKTLKEPTYSQTVCTSTWREREGLVQILRMRIRTNRIILFSSNAYIFLFDDDEIFWSGYIFIFDNDTFSSKFFFGIFDCGHMLIYTEQKIKGEPQ